MRAFANLLMYQAGWLACVLGAAHGEPWLGVAVAGGIVAVHLARAPHAKPEAWLVGAAIATGAIFESLLVQFEWVRYPNGALLEGTAPLWMVALWALFATTLNVSLRAFRERPWVAAAMGAVGAPLAYYAGARLGALQIAEPYAALGTVALAWAWAAPLLLAAARQHDGFAPT